MGVDYYAYTILGARYQKGELEREVAVKPSNDCCKTAENSTAPFCPACGARLHRTATEQKISGFDGDTDELDDLRVIRGTDGDYVYFGLLFGRVFSDDPGDSFISASVLPDPAAASETIRSRLGAHGLSIDNWDNRFGIWTVLSCSY